MQCVENTLLQSYRPSLQVLLTNMQVLLARKLQQTPERGTNVCIPNFIKRFIIESYYIVSITFSRLGPFIMRSTRRFVPGFKHAVPPGNHFDAIHVQDPRNQRSRPLGLRSAGYR